MLTFGNILGLIMMAMVGLILFYKALGKIEEDVFGIEKDVFGRIVIISVTVTWAVVIACWVLAFMNAG